MTTPQLLTVIDEESLKTWGSNEWKKWWIEPKYDGARMVYHKGQFFSRTGKPLHNLEHIAAELQHLKGWTLDGEVYGADWAATMSAARSSETAKPNNGLKFAVFDAMEDHEWENALATDHLWSRCDLVEDLVRGMTHVHRVPHFRGHSFLDFRLIHISNLASGCDGTVLKLSESLYEFKRTKTWLKVKPVQTEDGIVTGMVEGKGKYKGMLGALTVAFDGVETSVSGMDDKQRRVWWNENKFGMNRQNIIIGKAIEVECRGKHKSGCLIEPRFRRIREDK